MLSILVLGTSILFQIAAAILAIRLIKVTRAQVAWMTIAFAVILMAIRRSITLYHLISGNITRPPNLQAELVALLISVLMVIGIAMIRPLFLSIQKSKQSIKEREQNLMALAENASDGILVSVNGESVFANRRAAEILGTPVENLTNLAITDAIPTIKNNGHGRVNQSTDMTSISNSYETILNRKDGSPLTVELITTRTKWHGEAADMISIRDITERKQSEAQMKKLSGALEQTADYIVITNAGGTIEYVNPAFEAGTGFSKHKTIGSNPRMLKSGLQDTAFYKKMWETLRSGEIYQDVFINRKKTGELYHEEKTITPLKNKDGKITHYISTGKDVTERIQTQERLHYLAYHDVLTGLANRALFTERLEHAITRSRNAKDHLAILFLDIDRFKNINDTLGHNLGDDLLKILANKLTGCLREGDTVARLGGDEFAVLLEDISSEDDVSPIAKKILETLSEPITINEHELFETASIGISLFPEDGNNVDALLKNADTAMYRAKGQGRNNHQFYSADMSSRALERLKLETSLRHALEREEFILHYQPQLDLQTGRVIGNESLIRWNHPERGLIQPNDFIPLLEETGMIVPVGEWVIKTACAQNKAWQLANLPAIPVSINLSGWQFQDDSLIEKIDAALTETGLDPRYLDLEITESVLMENTQETMRIINTLSEMGIRFSVDDFGTGYSSLSYLKQFKIDTLKIDRSFIRDITTDPDDASIVTAIIVMAHSLNLSLVAEGVETKEQASFLRNLSCETVQGFLYHRPMPADQFEELLQHQRQEYCVSKAS